ncbi:hypothetical protein BC938DRAFT_484272 [Jimgerdemannia flammicorona]|uniref:Uncharacterized protein n=1 Tax=Jimgerdemannia flammicorona TaxID=994334 RepID=A0A433QA74_9FUNG|nr:hypothetical protein BC938DRAFT_484272 [Jimgerdemannia flammicorona]
MALRKGGAIFALLVLRHLVGGVLLASLTLAEGVPGFRNVDLRRVRRKQGNCRDVSGRYDNVMPSSRTSKLPIVGEMRCTVGWLVNVRRHPTFQPQAI